VKLAQSIPRFLKKVNVLFKKSLENPIFRGRVKSVFDGVLGIYGLAEIQVHSQNSMGPSPSRAIHAAKIWKRSHQTKTSLNEHRFIEVCDPCKGSNHKHTWIADMLKSASHKIALFQFPRWSETRINHI
jgi:hypothetical protein